jgi:hypothetical protein
MQMVELKEGKNAMDLLTCNFVGKVIRAFEDLNEIRMLARMQIVVELEKIDEFATIL